jgi:LAGLIDADG endonuclease
MSSDNPSGAVNQQERPCSAEWLDALPADLGNWVAGFVDGEGSFNVPIRRLRSGSMPFRISLSFNVSQLGSEEPRLLRNVFCAGTVRGRGDGVYYYEVTTVRELFGRVFPFFERYPLRGAKRHDLERFERIAALIQSGRHLSPQGFKEILSVRSPMNRGGKRRRSDDELVAALRTWNPQRPYARLPLEAEG